MLFTVQENTRVSAHLRMGVAASQVAQRSMFSSSLGLLELDGPVADDDAVDRIEPVNDEWTEISDAVDQQGHITWRSGPRRHCNRSQRYPDLLYKSSANSSLRSGRNIVNIHHVELSRHGLQILTTSLSCMTHIMSPLSRDKHMTACRSITRSFLGIRASGADSVSCASMRV